jgi:hypothetical protein
MMLEVVAVAFVGAAVGLVVNAGALLIVAIVVSVAVALLYLYAYGLSKTRGGPAADLLSAATRSLKAERRRARGT